MAFAQTQSFGLAPNSVRTCMSGRSARAPSLLTHPRLQQLHRVARKPQPVRSAQRGSQIVCTFEVMGPPQLSLQLPTADFQDNVELTVLRRRRGGNAILVYEVAPDSAAAKAGVRPGQQLLAISDPIREREVWDLNGLASLKYVRQTVSGRAHETLTVKFTPDPVPEWEQAVAAARAAVAAAGSAASAPGEELTAAEREELGRQLEKMQEKAQAKKLEARNQKLEVRKAYEEENRQKDTKPVFAVALFSLVLLLPLCILLVAFNSGYIAGLGDGRTF